MEMFMEDMYRELKYSLIILAFIKMHKYWCRKHQLFGQYNLAVFDCVKILARDAFNRP